jgi:ABC-type transport system involved in cytochrome c biogenesis permease component
LAFYFFNKGLGKKSLHHIFLVPLIMLPYGFLLTLLIYAIKPVVVNGSENPFIMIGAIGAALSLGSKKGRIMLSLLVMPFYI